MLENQENKKIVNSSAFVLFNKYLVDYFSVIVIIVVVLVIIFGYFGLLRPKYENVVKNNKQYQLDRETELEQLNLNIIAYKNYKKIFDSIDKNDKIKVEAFLPNKNDSEELLIYMRDVVAKTGLRLIALDIDTLGDVGETAVEDISAVEGLSVSDNVQDQENQNVNEIKINLSVGGINYQSLKSFIYNLERDSRFFEIEEVDFSLSGKTLSLKLKTFYLK